MIYRWHHTVAALRTHQQAVFLHKVSEGRLEVIRHYHGLLVPSCSPQLRLDSRYSLTPVMQQHHRLQFPMWQASYSVDYARLDASVNSYTLSP